MRRSRPSGPRSVPAGASKRSLRVPGPDRQALTRLATLVTHKLGIRMPESKLAMLESRLQRRMQALGLSSLREYAERIEHGCRHEHGSEELKLFYDAVTTNKTDFFREPQHFQYLYEKALPTLAHAQHGHWNCRVWCAGCSSGEEVYTLAMVLAEYERTHQNFAFSLVASDISTRVLATARAATYPEAAAEPIPLALRSRYLLRNRSQARRMVRIAPELRSRVQFVRLNFMDERYPIEGRLDIIFFRNVMIYFDKQTQQRVLERQCSLLKAGGYLFISLTENLTGLQLPLASVASSVFRKTSCPRRSAY